jgi:hypothetical protein
MVYTAPYAKASDKHLSDGQAEEIAGKAIGEDRRIHWYAIGPRPWRKISESDRHHSTRRQIAFFTDGLTDGIGGETPEERVCEAIARGATISNLQSLLSPKFNEDDITMILLTRLGWRQSQNSRIVSIDEKTP